MPKDVADCPVHTRLDQRGDRFRVEPCEWICNHLVELKGRPPLTRFLIQLMRMSNADVAKASAAKAAKGFKISKEHAEGYIRMERERRGLHVGAKA